MLTETETPVTPKKRISKKLLFTTTVKILQPMFRLTDWNLTIQFTKRMKATADCDAAPEYKSATIRVNLKELEHLTEYVVISTAIHELIHCVVWPLGSWAERLSKNDTHKLNMTTQFEESVVCSLEGIFVPLVLAEVNKELSRRGYAQVDSSFDELVVYDE